MKKKVYIFLLGILLLISGCTLQAEGIKIPYGDRATVQVGETFEIKLTKTNGVTGQEIWTSSNDCAQVNDSGVVLGVSGGISIIKCTIGSYVASIEITVIPKKEVTLTLSAPNSTLLVESKLELSCVCSEEGKENEISYEIKEGSEYATLTNHTLEGVKSGIVKIVCHYQNITSNTLTITILAKEEEYSLSLQASKTTFMVGETITLSVNITPYVDDALVNFEFTRNGSAVQLNGNKLTALEAGKNIGVVATYNGSRSNEITLTTIAKTINPTSITLSSSKTTLAPKEEAKLACVVSPTGAQTNVTYVVTSGKDVISLSNNIITANKVGFATIQATLGSVVSNTITIEVKEKLTDPYETMTSKEFYADYTEATSYLDSYYRSLHYFMSGSIVVPEQAPTLAQDQPMSGDVMIRNDNAIYSDDYSTYFIVDDRGSICDEIYKGGAYITLEEVAAYVYAFGDVPVNYSSNKSASPKKSEWKEYLRVNHTYFSGNTTSYPYEPILPDISGCGGKLDYYEIDIGTTGTDCDPDYASKIYNNGSTITRGAARIVYTRYDETGSEISDTNKKYVFYTFNHYNDFQEYLNYQGGWGKIFGNITGGGSISSKTDYNPTSYIPTERRKF
jgi:hypothetical protein